MTEGKNYPIDSRAYFAQMNRRVAMLERALQQKARQGQVDVHDRYIDQLLNGTLSPTFPDLVVTNKVTAADLEAERIRLSATDDASLTSTGHAFQIGPTNGLNLIADQNEIMARNNGQQSFLSLRDNTEVHVPDPTSSTGAATKAYVDSEVLLAGGGASAWWPSETQTINFSRDVSTLKSHITLCWSDYNPGDGPQNYHWFIETISKSWILANSGVGSSHLIPLNSSDSSACTKYIYIYSNRIVGASTNDDAPQNDAALRAIYGY